MHVDGGSVGFEPATGGLGIAGRGSCALFPQPAGEQPRRWGRRETDVDILPFDDLTSEEKDLTLPHPGIAERDFVRAPLAELRPDILG